MGADVMRRERAAHASVGTGLRRKSRVSSRWQERRQSGPRPAGGATSRWSHTNVGLKLQRWRTSDLTAAMHGQTL